MLKKISYWLLIVGGLNWLAFGIFTHEIGDLLGGMDSGLARIVYVIVGLATLVKLFGCKKGKKQMTHTSMPSHDSPMGGGM